MTTTTTRPRPVQLPLPDPNVAHARDALALADRAAEAFSGALCLAEDLQQQLDEARALNAAVWLWIMPRLLCRE